MGPERGGYSPLRDIISGELRKTVKTSVKVVEMRTGCNPNTSPHLRNIYIYILHIFYELNKMNENGEVFTYACISERISIKFGVLELCYC